MAPEGVTSALKPVCPAASHRNVGEPSIIVDDQDRAVIGADAVAIVAALKLRDRTAVRGGIAYSARLRDGGTALLVRGTNRRRHEPPDGFLRHEDLRQVERERAAHARRADQPNFAAEQARHFAADRQAQARAAVLAARAAVGLLERLEDDLLLLRRNADAGIGHRERDHGVAGSERVVVGMPAVVGDADSQARLARDA